MASSDVLEVEVRTGISDDEAQAQIDRLGSRGTVEQAARSLKARRKS
ncbi:hypothetical protein NKI20_17145 [Mesorhizobium sp. M0830]